jgi:DNA-directed RNA polymerase subunit omega
MAEPTINIDELLQDGSVDSRYTLVILAAKRAREINSYYSQLGEGRGEFVPPLVESLLGSKPLAIAMQEISDRKVTYERLETPAAE